MYPENIKKFVAEKDTKSLQQEIDTAADLFVVNCAKLALADLKRLSCTPQSSIEAYKLYDEILNTPPDTNDLFTRTMLLREWAYYWKACMMIYDKTLPAEYRGKEDIALELLHLVLVTTKHQKLMHKTMYTIAKIYLYGTPKQKINYEEATRYLDKLAPLNIGEELKRQVDACYAEIKKQAEIYRDNFEFLTKLAPIPTKPTPATDSKPPVIVGNTVQILPQEVMKTRNQPPRKKVRNQVECNVNFPLENLLPKQSNVIERNQPTNNPILPSITYVHGNLPTKEVPSLGLNRATSEDPRYSQKSPSIFYGQPNHRSNANTPTGSLDEFVESEGSKEPLPHNTNYF